MEDLQDIDEYSTADFGRKSSAYNELIGELENEVSQESIELSDFVGRQPAYLTPVMLAWYQDHVEAKRIGALATIDAIFSSIGEKGRTVFLALETDRIEDDRLDRKRTIKKAHIDRNQAAYGRLSALREAMESAEQLYQDKQNDHGGRHPTVPGWWYWLLLGFVGIFEAMINFESFSALNFMTPAIALGSTVVIAIVLALASHLHGTLIKQWSYYFGEHREDIDRFAAHRMWVLGSIALGAVLGSVWYARAAYLAESITEAAIIGGTEPSWLSTVGGSLLLNLAVYIAGVIIAYLSHDRDPSFTDAFLTRAKFQRQYRAAQEKIERANNRQFRRIDAEAEERLKAARAADRVLRNRHRNEYREAERQFKRLVAKDAAVESTLNDYRNKLVAAARGQKLMIKVPAQIRTEDSDVELISPQKFNAKPIRLKYILSHKA